MLGSDKPLLALGREKKAKKQSDSVIFPDFKAAAGQCDPRKSVDILESQPRIAKDSARKNLSQSMIK